MNCSNCGQPLEAGAAFCGNCGHPILQTANMPNANQDEVVSENAVADSGPVSEATTQDGAVTKRPSESHSSIAQIYNNQSAGTSPQSATYPRGLAVATAAGVPSYAVPVASRQDGELKASMSLVVGILGIVGSIFIPLVGLGLGIAGVVLATMSRRTIKHGIGTAGLIISGLALLTGLASWALVISHDPRFSHKAASTPTTITGPSVSAQSITTPCYTADFGSTLNIQNNNGSCNMNAYNGVTLDASSDAYKVYGTFTTVGSSNFINFAKQAIESDVAQSLPSFTITHENSGQFAGSQAYFVTATNNQGIGVMEAVALHATTNGDNFFVFVHAVNSNTVNLNSLQTGWQWQ